MKEKKGFTMVHNDDINAYQMDIAERDRQLREAGKLEMSLIEDRDGCERAYVQTKEQLQDTRKELHQARKEGNENFQQGFTQAHTLA